MEAALCLIQLAKLGDFIQSTALICELKKIWPAHKIYLAVSDPALISIIKLSGLVDEIVIWQKADDLLPLELQRPFEAVFVLNSHLRATSLAEKITAKEYYGPKSSGGNIIFTPVQNFIKSLMPHRRLGAFNLVDIWRSLVPGATGPGQYFWPALDAPAAQLPSGLKVGFQLGSRNHLRRWPGEHFTQMILEMSRHLNFQAHLLGSAGEAPLGRRLSQKVEAVNLMGQTTLPQLAGIIQELDLVVSGDTGVLHLAAVLGRPAFGLFFGPAYGPETGPYGEGHLIYQTLAPCAPCVENGQCRKKVCELLPDPILAAQLAVRQINGQRITELSLPSGHSVWRTTLDDFGQSLQPQGLIGLKMEMLQSIFLRQLGRCIMRPSYDSLPPKLWDPFLSLPPEGNFLHHLTESDFSAKLIKDLNLNIETKKIDAYAELFLKSLQKLA